MSVYTDPDPREEKLPKWAQQKLDVLRMRVAEGQERLRELGPGESTVFMDPYADVPVGLGKDPKIEFTFPDYFGGRGDLARRYIQVSRAGSRVHGALLIHASAAILVQPRSTNTVELRDVRLT